MVFILKFVFFFFYPLCDVFLSLIHISWGARVNLVHTAYPFCIRPSRTYKYIRAHIYSLKRSIAVCWMRVFRRVHRFQYAAASCTVFADGMHRIYTWCTLPRVQPSAHTGNKGNQHLRNTSSSCYAIMVMVRVPASMCLWAALHRRHLFCLVNSLPFSCCGSFIGW